MVKNLGLYESFIFISFAHTVYLFYQFCLRKVLQPNFFTEKGSFKNALVILWNLCYLTGINHSESVNICNQCKIFVPLKMHSEFLAYDPVDICLVFFLF